MIRNLIQKYSQIIRYIFAGCVATGSNLAILFILVHYFKLWYLTSSIISFCCAVVISYLLQKFFVFRNYERGDMHKQFLHFFIYNIVMLGVNTLLMYFFVDIVSIWYLLAQALCAIIIACMNYIYFNKIVFKKV
ncbi:MAG: GtrA family protein [Candidatus Paceibacterota bacterium]|jgi:putative flippase GtrA